MSFVELVHFSLPWISDKLVNCGWKKRNKMTKSDNMSVGLFNNPVLLTLRLATVDMF